MRRRKKKPFSGLRSRSIRKTGTLVEPNIRRQYDRKRAKEEGRKAADEAAFDFSAAA